MPCPLALLFLPKGQNKGSKAVPFPFSFPEGVSLPYPSLGKGWERKEPITGTRKRGPIARKEAQKPLSKASFPFPSFPLESQGMVGGAHKNPTIGVGINKRPISASQGKLMRFPNQLVRFSFRSAHSVCNKDALRALTKSHNKHRRERERAPSVGRKRSYIYRKGSMQPQALARFSADLPDGSMPGGFFGEYFCQYFEKKY